MTDDERSPLHDALHPFEAAEEEFAREFPEDAAAEREKAESGEAKEQPAPETDAAEEKSGETPPPAEKRKLSPPELVRRGMIVLFLLVMLISACKLGSMMVNYYKNDKGYSDLAEEMVSTPPPTAEPAPPAEDEELEEEEEEEETEPEEYAPIIVNMKGLLKRNPDTVAWLYCEDTPIDFAIVQSTNNDTYMGWDFDRQPSIFGWTFMDYRCRGDFSGYCHTIYGHNMQNGSVFACLEKFQEQSYYEEHPVMWLITPEGSFKMRLIAGAFYHGTEECYAGFGDNEAGYREFLRTAVANSTFDSGIDPETVDKVVMLSTCSNVWPDMRFAVIGTMEPVAG